MKKRGQTPDAHTYTILFSGLARYSDYPQALSKALSIYHSMEADNSPVQPNVIHTNAVLKVCARAGDMDALFGIAAKLRRKGLRAPNNLTFTTILNAIRQHATEEPEGRLHGPSPLRVKAVTDARKIWDDVVGRWRQGDIFIDEELVCSMGRVLLKGEEQDWDDVFSLVEQTMNVPRFVPPLGTTMRNQIEPSHQGKADTAAPGNSPPVSSDDTNSTDLVQHNEFRKVKPPTPTKGVSAYAKPGVNSLSLVFEALLKLRMKRSSAEYWEAFTVTHNVKPDSINFHNYLRVLRVNHASSDTVELLLRMPKSMMEKKTFRIAMAACARDKNSPSAFANAGKVLDLMQQNLTSQDMVALHSYLEVAVYGAVGPRFKQPTEGSPASEYARGRQMLRALERLAPSLVNLRATIAYSDPPETEEGVAAAKSTRDGALALVREMISAYDKLMNKGMVARETYGYLIAERAKLAAFVTRYNDKVSDKRLKAPRGSEKGAGREKSNEATGSTKAEST
jgi:hypothetical protein